MKDTFFVEEEIIIFFVNYVRMTVGLFLRLWHGCPIRDLKANYKERPLKEDEIKTAV